MHIRRLELQGFKSFKDKTVINFDDGITGIVGPNGCGKSNVVDAFFWVMGEQNARQLRGQNMDDLIFSGSDKSPPGSFAEVTLILEMPAELSGPNAPAGASSKDEGLLSFPTREVAITRKLYRTGESDYFINKTPCRLKDIQELFMDTGVGARGYSIIQQGQIAKIVQAKPEDRRTMIEEVAGIVKYKARRRESMRKLEGTQQNLLRVTDVINELESQKRMMERQADKARKYKEWKEKLQSIELQFNALKWEDHSNRLGTLEQEIDLLNAEDVGLTTARETAETQISQKRMELAQASRITEEFQNKWIDSGNRLNNVENDLKYSQKNLTDLRNSFVQLEKDTEEERVLVETLSAQHEELKIESLTIDEQFHTAEEKRIELDAIAQEKKRDAEEVERSTEDSKRRLYQLASEIEKARSAAEYSQLRLLELGETLERIGAERAEREEQLALISEQKAEATEKLSTHKLELDSMKSKIQTTIETVSAKNRELDEKRKEISRIHSDQARIRTTLKTLEDQKLRHEDASKGVKNVFQTILPKNEQLKSNILGTLADLLQVEKGFETAVESSLGKTLELVVTRDAQSHQIIADALREGKSGRASFADVKKLQGLNVNTNLKFNAPEELKGQILGELTKFVRVQKTEAAESVSVLLDHLLGQIIVVKDSESAQKLSEKFTTLSFVTSEGEIFRGGWFMEGGDKSAVSGAYVGRNREITELSDSLKVSEESLIVAQDNLQILETAIGELQEERKSLEEEYRAKQNDLSQLSSEEATLRNRTQDAERAMEKYRQEEQRSFSEKDRLTLTEMDAKEKQETLSSEKIELEMKVEKAAQELTMARAVLEEAQQNFVNARIKAANIGDQRASLQTRTRQSENALSQHQNRIENMLETAKKRQAESEETAVRIETLQSQIEGLRNDLVIAEQNYRSAKDQLDILNNEVEEQRSAAQEHSNRERTVKDNLMTRRLEQQRIQGDADILAQNTLERYGLVLAEYAMMPETQEQVQLLREAGEDMIHEIQNEVTFLKEKIRKLGDVNPAAVEEYEAIVERFNLLSTQKSDLEKAMKDLSDTVERINKVSKERFERAFAEVNTHFKRVFPVIFGGGHAHLTLTNPEDMLETGVDITAQPPGKKPQNINLLSGGEKTLTAISLLFSIFLVKPSPFCLLDEVDAPLDDANIGRFNALLREMAKRSQFIIITHNKRTMELNDKLYGVTMEDAGVSKMVSIQLSAAG